MKLTEPLLEGLRASVLGQADVIALLGEWESAPSVHTKRPVPSEAGYPLVLIPSANAAETNQDGLVSRRPVLVRDLFVYGLQPSQLREVDNAADYLKAHFHRNRFSIAVEGWHVIDVVASGPTPAPVDDAKQVGRHIQLTIRLKAT